MCGCAHAHLCECVWSPEAGMECLSLLSAPSVWMQGLLLNPELAELVQLANLLYEFSASISQVLRLQVSLHPHPDWGA